MEDGIVIVVDTSNYKTSYSESVPFKARVIKKFELEVRVQSDATGKEYELYYDQLLENLDIEEIKLMINLKEYGSGSS